MLTKEELMIGDWVMYNPNVFIDDEYESTKEWFPTQINSGEDIDLAIEGCYAPIPLTTDILEKNGWKVKKGFVQHGNFGDGPLMLWHTEENKILRHFTHELEISDLSTDKGYRVRIECNYVHELQRALRLCGIKKMFEL